MATPRALILRTAGTNCDLETKYAFEKAGAEAKLVHINRIAAESAPFAEYQAVVIPGGFTYGDDIAAGKVLAGELTHVLGDQLHNFIARGGLVMGICNGFQVLVKTGFLPAGKPLPASDRQITLTWNDSNRFEARWVRLAAPRNTKCVFVEPGDEMELPVAHGEGKLLARTSDIVKNLVDEGQVVFRYTSSSGGAPSYPEDPNGSVDNIAGICDESGRIFGLMPHPERHIQAWHHPRWTAERRQGEGDGLRIFRRAVEYLKQ